MIEQMPNQWLLDASREAMHRSAELLRYARSRRQSLEGVRAAVPDDELERIAIEVQHLPPDKAQAEYDRRVRELEEGENNDER